MRKKYIAHMVQNTCDEAVRARGYLRGVLTALPPS